MTLGQFSVVVGAPTRWVQNAMAVLGLPARYDAEGARRIALVRVVHEACGIPLARAYVLAGEALALWPARTEWRHVSEDGLVTLSVDLGRFLSGYAVRLSLARCHYAEKRRGRQPRRRRRGVAGARAYGVDIGLLEENLRRTPAERLQRLDADVAFLQSLKVAEP